MVEHSTLTVLRYWLLFEYLRIDALALELSIAKMRRFKLKCLILIGNEVAAMLAVKERAQLNTNKRPKKPVGRRMSFEEALHQNVIDLTPS